MNEAYEGQPADELYQQAVHLMKEFAESKGSPFFSKLVDQFSTVTRTFSSPDYLPQDSDNQSQRTDDMVGGFPYTSKSYPWPKMPVSDLPMQPIVQLNLGTVGKILGTDFGTELLQVWGPVAPTMRELSVDIKHFMLRLIPLDALAEAPSDFLPDWRSASTGSCKTAFHMEIADDEPAAGNPRLQWGQPLPMFGSMQHLLEMAWSDHAIEAEEMGKDELIDVSIEFIDYLDPSGLTVVRNPAYIGGFGGQDGGEYDPSYGDDLLFRFSDGNGFFFAIKWTRGAKHGLKFQPAFTIRAL
ncbi:MAG: hypothetical protein WCH60_14290 [Burkholderiales bacterium]